MIQIKQNLIASLQEEVSYLRIEEQLQNPNIQKQILNLEQIIKTKICADLPNAFGKENSILLHYIMKRILTKNKFQQKLVQPK